MYCHSLQLMVSSAPTNIPASGSRWIPSAIERDLRRCGQQAKLLGRCGDPQSFFWAGRRVLLTGHTGFKGSWLSLWLLSLGAEVWGYALAPEGQHSLFVDLALAQGQLHHHLGDLRDLEALRAVVHQAQPQVVFHLAAQPLVRRSYRDPLGYLGHQCAGQPPCVRSSQALAAPLCCGHGDYRQGV